MSVAAQLQTLGVTLPAAPAAVGSYVGVVRTGNLIVTSGQLPWKDGKLLYTGRLGDSLSVEQGYEAAKQCAVNALAQIQSIIGDLDKVKQVVRVEGYVHCGPGFRQHPQALNGASEFLNAVFGDRGKHTRTALGIADMPVDAPIQLVLWVEV
jgi:enamine deaminase RidA (YjgF/YER057c/UK114 family)